MGFFDKIKQRRMDDISKKMSTHTHISKKISTHTNKSTSTYNKKSSILTEEMAQTRYIYPTKYVESREYVNAKKLLEASVIFGNEFVKNIQYKLEHKLDKIQITDLKNEGLWI